MENSELNSTKEGFTLVELSIAITIYLVAFTAILSIESSSLDSLDRSRQMTVVGTLAKNLLIDTENLLEGMEFSEAKEEENGQFEAPYQEFNWKREVKEIEFPQINVSQGDEGGDENDQLVEKMTKLVTNFLSKAIREVSVTVDWKRGKGRQYYSVTTYWVNLNEEFSINE